MAIENVQLEVIDDNPYNPRKHYPQQKVYEMANSLRENGLREKPEGRRTDGRVQLAYGHMRLRGFRQNQKKDPENWKTMPIDVKDISDQDMFHFAWEENMRRTDMTAIELARSFLFFNELFPEVLDEEIAKKHSMSAQNVSNMKRVLRLPEKFLEKIDEGLISFTQGRELLTLEGLPDAENLMSQAINRLNTGNKQYGYPNTVDGLQKAIHETIHNQFPPLEKDFAGYRYDLIFDTRAANCLQCEKMIRTHPTKSQTAHFCIDKACWDAKQTEHREQAAAAARAKMKEDVIKRTAQVIAAEEKAPAPGDFSQEKPEPELMVPDYTAEKRGNSWIGLDGQGQVISIGTTKLHAEVLARESFKPVATVLNPGPDAYKLNHTYRIIHKNKTENIPDVTAQDLPTAIKAVDVKPEDVESVKVWKSSGKLGTAGGVTAGWSKCTDPLEALAPLAAVEEAEPALVEAEKILKIEEAREKANLERPAGEIPCETCRNGKTCDRSFFYVPQDDSGRYVCDQWEPHFPPSEEMAKPGEKLTKTLTEAPATEIPDAVLQKAKEAAGTRAEVLDLNDICTGEEHWRQVKSGYALLSGELRLLDDPEECTERCTHGFHYAFDSKAREQKEIIVCSDTKCLAKKKGALTRKRNAAGQARKNAEKEAIKQVLDQVGQVVELATDHVKGIAAVAGIKAPVVAVTRPVLVLIIYNQLHGKQVRDYYYGNGTKDTEKWLWDKLSAGTTKEQRKEPALWKLVRKLTDAELVKLIVEMMFYYLQDSGEPARYEIKTMEPLAFFGIAINDAVGKPGGGDGGDEDDNDDDGDEDE